MSRNNIPGRDAYLWLYDDFLASNPREDAIVVEVGVALGKSISYLAECCISENRRDIQIYAVDTWAGTARNGEQQAMGDAAGGDFSLYCKTMLEHCPQAFEMIRVLGGTRRGPFVRSGVRRNRRMVADTRLQWGHWRGRLPRGGVPRRRRGGCVSLRRLSQSGRGQARPELADLART